MNVKRFINTNKSTLALILVFFAFRWSFADHYRVPSGSMLPTIQLGDDILTNKMAYDFRIPFTDYILAKGQTPKRGDVIVFMYPKDESVNFIKRVVGLPNDTLKISGNKIYINTQVLNEPYLTAQFKNYIYEQDIEIQIPEDMYFVMGDNRSNSLDSRYWGFVPRKNIKGKALKVLWNISFADFIPSIDLFRIGHSI